MRRSRLNWLFWLGAGSIVSGTVLIALGGYRIAASPEFLAAYRIRYVDAVYTGQAMDAQDVFYFKKEAARLRSGCVVAATGLGLLIAGVVVARGAGTLRYRRKRSRIAVFSRQLCGISRQRAQVGARRS